MKEHYSELELEVLLFDVTDIVTASEDKPSGLPEDNEGQNIDDF